MRESAGLRGRPAPPSVAAGFDPERKDRALGPTVIGAALLVNALVCVFLYRNVQASLERSEEHALVTSRNFGSLLAQNLDVVFDKVDRALLSVADEHRRQVAVGGLDPSAMAAALARQRALAPDLISLRAADAEGRVDLGSPESAEGTSVADRDYFQALRRDPKAGMLISKPTNGRIIKVPLIVNARALTLADGSFAGAVFGSLSLDHLSRLIATAGVGPRGVVILRYADLSLVIRRTGDGDERTLGEDPPAELVRLVAAGASAGSYRSVSPLDGVDRIYSFTKVADRPLLVSVGLSVPDLLAGWRREAAQAATMAALFALVTSLATWFALRSFRKLRRAAAELARDIQERERAQESLRESEGRLAATFAAFPDALAISHYQTGQYVLVNQGFAQLTGWPVAEVIGKTSAELELWVDRADRAAVVGAIAELGSLDDYEARFRRRDKTILTGRLSGRVITIEGAQYLLTITRDVTRQRQLEAQLQQAQRLESVGRLAGGVAHDFNNMLLVILGEAALLEESLPEGHAGRESLREIIRAAERSRDLTRQLLTFSRKQVISPKVVDLNALVSATRQALARLIGEDVGLVFEPGRELWPVRLDQGQFDQVLINLVANARDAMPDGGTLTIRTANAGVGEAQARELTGLVAGDYLSLSVSDTGVGMTAETLAHLFEPFFTTKEPGKGTGLGLSTAYGIVKQNGGGIFVASAPGRGTTLTIYLPRSTAPVQETLAPAGEPPIRGVGTILVVEDEASVRATARKMLESLGYTVLEAAGGEEALAMARAADLGIRLLVTDVVMQGMKGPELSERLRALRPGIKTLLMSGHTGGALGTLGVVEEGVRFLQKPFTLHDLAREVHEALASPAT